MLQEPVFEAQTCKEFGAEFEETSLQLALDQELAVHWLWHPVSRLI
jgi:hypothetical protein